MSRRSPELPLADPATQKGRPPHTKYLLPGNRNLSRIRKAPLHERAAEGVRLEYGDNVGVIAKAVLKGIKLKVIDVGVGRMILDRVLPASRPIRLDLPQIDSGRALIEAEAKITTAMNAGVISPAEARTLQAWAKHSWRARRVAAVNPRR